ncbi:MAG: hypothetical protein J6U40_11510 [Kiritimatiellae bacterium]|nr:hypothetical protein [Kiritimatiellia bacterium]
MKQRKDRTLSGMLRRAGFSLVEVNMAVFVMAIGILGMIALYPLGLRESMQSTADLKQSSTADYLLNQVVAIASMTNFPWSQWNSMPEYEIGAWTLELENSVPDFIRSRMMSISKEGKRQGSFSYNNSKFKIGCFKQAGRSDRIMGIVVQSTESKNAENYNQYSNNPVYFAEAFFQGDPTK